MVAKCILLPVDEMLCRLDAQLIGFNLRPAMRRRPKSDQVRRNGDVAVKLITSDMMNSDADGHNFAMDALGATLFGAFLFLRLRLGLSG